MCETLWEIRNASKRHQQSKQTKGRESKSMKCKKLIEQSPVLAIPEYIINFKRLYLAEYLPKWLQQESLESLGKVLSHDYFWSSIGVFF